MSTLSRVLISLVFLNLGSFANLAISQDRQIVYRLIVPFPPNGTPDKYARKLAAGLGNKLGVPVVVENREDDKLGGATGIEYIANYPPDGRSYLFFSATTMAFMTSQRTRNNFSDLLDRIRGVALLGIDSYAIAVPISKGVANLGSLIQMGRSIPLSLGIGGTLQAICIRQFAEAAGLQRAVYVSYKSTPEIINALVGGLFDATCSPVSIVKPRVDDGSVKVLATTFNNSSESGMFPGVPTLDSAGIQGVIRGNWFAIVAASGTSLSQLNPFVRGIRQAIFEHSLVQELEKGGFMTVPAKDVSPELTDAFLRKQRALLASSAKLSTNSPK